MSDYSQIYLVPNYSTINSRSLADTSIGLGNFKFNLPIIPSNMETVINFQLAMQLARDGHFYIMHRFIDDFDLRYFIEDMNREKLPASISVGVKQKDIEFLSFLVKMTGLNVDFITIDVAHGHHELVKRMCKFIKSEFSNTFLIVGNVATPQAVLDLESWGADAVKIGVAPGLGCRTYNKTGFLSPMPETILSCSKVATKPLIADGGIREPGDIAKALALGASMVMIGSYLAGHADSPGEIIERDGKQFKVYAGSTANNNLHVEGRSLELPLKGYLTDTYYDIKQSLQSAISYAGGYNLTAFNNVKWKNL